MRGGAVRSLKAALALVGVTAIPPAAAVAARPRPSCINSRRDMVPGQFFIDFSADLAERIISKISNAVERRIQAFANDGTLLLKTARKSPTTRFPLPTKPIMVPDR